MEDIEDTNLGLGGRNFKRANPKVRTGLRSATAVGRSDTPHLPWTHHPHSHRPVQRARLERIVEEDPREGLGSYFAALQAVLRGQQRVLQAHLNIPAPAYSVGLHLPLLLLLPAPW